MLLLTATSTTTTLRTCYAQICLMFFLLLYSKQAPIIHPSRAREREREKERMPRFTTATYKEQFGACSHSGPTLSRSQVLLTSLIIEGVGYRERERVELERERESKRAVRTTI